MIPFGVNAQDTPSTAELWKEEKTKYRPLVIIFSVAMLLIVAMYLSALIWNVIGADSSKAPLIASAAAAYMKADANLTLEAATAQATAGIDNWYNIYTLGIPSGVLGLVAIATGWLGFSLIQSYRAKTFEKIASSISYILVITSLVALFELFSIIWRNNPDARFAGGVYLIIARVLLVITAFFISPRISALRRRFAVARQVAELKASPEYQALQKQISSGAVNPNSFANPMMGPFGMIIPPNQAQGINSIAVAPLVAQTVVAPEAQELNGMELDDLKQIAKRLSLSGYESMTREQLIANILRVTPPTSEVDLTAKKLAREQELQAMTVVQLKKVAKKLLISGHEKMSKEELVASILNASMSADLK